MIIKRQYYRSEQREYSVISELYHSGGKRVYKKYVGRARKKLAQKMSDIADKQKINVILASRKLGDIKEITPENKPLGRHIAKEANKNGIRIFDNDIASRAVGENYGNARVAFYPSYVESVRRIKKDPTKYYKYPRGIRKVMNHIADNGKVINISGDYSNNAAVMAHELGHELNSKSKGLSRLINKLDDKTRDYEFKDYVPDSSKRKLKNKVGSIMHKTKNAVVRHSQGILTSLEERNAWDKGIKIMKKSGKASKKEIELAKLRKKAAVETDDRVNKYKLAKYWENKLQIPSRRKKK